MSEVMTGQEADNRVVFGSAAWAAAAARIIDEIAHEYGSRLAGCSATVCEVYTDAPASLGGPTIAVTFGIEEGHGFAELGERGSTDVRIVMPFERARVGATTIVSHSDEDIAARDARRAEAIAAGIVQAERSSDVAPVIRKAFGEMHNRLAALIAE